MAILSPAPKGILQIVNAFSATTSLGNTTTIPIDDTIPQNTEGTEFTAGACTITPKNPNSIILLEAVLNVSMAAAGVDQIVAALFKDSTANALASAIVDLNTVDKMYQIVLNYQEASSNTTARTYKIRAGAAAAASWSINGLGSGRLLGGVMTSGIRAYEILT